MRHILFALLLSVPTVGAIISPSAAEEQPKINRTGPYKVGDYVEVWGNFWGSPAWTVCLIQEIADGKYLIHYGGGRYNTSWIEEKSIRNEAREKEAERHQEMMRSFNDEVRPLYRDHVASLINYYRSGIFNVTSATHIGSSADLKLVVDKLAEFDVLCKGKYAGLKDDESWNNEFEKIPATWCKVAEKRVELALKLVEARVAETQTLAKEFLASESRNMVPIEAHVVAGSWYKGMYSGNYSSVRGIMKTAWRADLVTTGGQSNVEKVKAEVGAYYDALGVPVPESQQAFLDEYAKGLASLKVQFDENLPPMTFVATGRDAAMLAAGAEGISGKILKHAVMSPGWVVRKNDLNIPMYRIKVGTLIYEDGPYCVYRSYIWRQEHSGGGRYAAGVVTEPTELYQRCK